VLGDCSAVNFHFPAGSSIHLFVHVLKASLLADSTTPSSEMKSPAAIFLILISPFLDHQKKCPHLVESC
jgi:hypothetical protein